MAIRAPDGANKSDKWSETQFKGVNDPNIWPLTVVFNRQSTFYQPTKSSGENKKPTKSSGENKKRKNHSLRDVLDRELD